MIFTRRFGALAARPQFPDAPELQELDSPADLDAELAKLLDGDGDGTAGNRQADDRTDESAA